VKIVVFEVDEWEEEGFSSLQDEHEVELVDQKLTADNAVDYSDADIISTFIYSELDRRVLEQFDDLKLIATRSTGYDHIDTDYCQEQEIVVCNVPSYGKNVVAEHTFALLLTLSRKLVEAIDRTRRGNFTFRGLCGFDLRGKTLGVIGTGDIGQFVIRIAQGFDMQIIAYDVVQNDELLEKYDFDYVELDELLANADIVTLHVPATEKTHHMISYDEFGKMKDGVVLLNTARGSVVDTSALVQALDQGKVAAAGLDVLPEEPVIQEEAELLRSVYQNKHDTSNLLANHVLMSLPNVVVTPHSAFYTIEAIERILTTTVDNIHSFMKGEPQNAVVGGED
jgi:D-lactate dehydrogenase